MKIYHLVDEITEKNQSIVSIIKKISDYKIWNFVRVVSKKSDVKKKNLRNVIYLNNFLKDYLLYFSSLRKIIKNKPSTIVHIHGLWRPIYFFSLLFCKFNRIPFVIQPHGMLLEDALKSNTYINYLFKVLTLKVYNIFLKKVCFLAVTKEETESIKKYFQNPNIRVIESPFEFNRHSQTSFYKKFVYFGRINQIKNIHLMISAFIDSKPAPEWSLELYGIQDDNKYLKYLKKIISESQYSGQILIKEPVFGFKKYKIMTSAWYNVLISKSEILSLSVLESLSVGTPSIVNKNIYFPNWIKKNIFLSNIYGPSLKNSFKKIMQLKYSTRQNKRKKIIKNFDSNYSVLNIRDKYINYVKSIISNKIEQKKTKQERKITKISLITIANSLNLFLLPFVVILFAFNGQSEISADLSIVSGSVLILCQVFSANARVILITNFSEGVFKEFVGFRIFLSFIFLIFYSFFAYKFPILLNYNNDLLVLIILLSWLNELNLIYLENKKMFRSLTIYIVSMFIVYFFIFYSVLFGTTETSREILKYYSLFYVFFILYYFNFSDKKIDTLEIFKILKNFRKLALLSSISNIIAVLIWRYSIYFTYDKKIAGLMIAAFSVASFPGTLINNIVGPTLVKIKFRKKFLSTIRNLLFIFIILLAIIFIFNTGKINVFYSLINVSLIGTIILIFSIYLKNLLMVKSLKLHKKVFTTDILYSISIMPLIVILDMINGYTLASYAYLISGVFSFIFYFSIYKNYENNF